MWRELDCVEVVVLVVEWLVAMLRRVDVVGVSWLVVEGEEDPCLGLDNVGLDLPSSLLCSSRFLATEAFQVFQEFVL